MGDISNLQALNSGDDDMFERMIEELKTKILEAVERYLKSRETLPPRLTKLISRVELKEELKISDNTLSKWESQGLKRYQPPDEGSRMIYYLVTDIWKFLGVGE